VRTQAVLSRKHLGFAALRATAGIAARLALRGQTNFLKMIWKFNSVYNTERQCGDHQQPVKYAMRPPAAPGAPKPRARDLFVHIPAAVHVPGRGNGAEATASVAAEPGSTPSR
jgi:hopanoid C-3 methylase